jgi:hypothetical protein
MVEVEGSVRDHFNYVSTKYQKYIYVRTKFESNDYASNNKMKTTKPTKQAINLILYFSIKHSKPTLETSNRGRVRNEQSRDLRRR